MNKGIVFSLAFLVCIGFGVSRVKYEVVFLKNRLKDINAKIERCSDDIRVYSAEWGYLNDPKRLKKLASKYLPNFRPTDNSQIIDYSTIVSSGLSENVEKSFDTFLDKALEREQGGFNLR